ncbi:MAG: hypothetical protein OXG33_13195 [Chloroflexi bacterium]|nr:hypothetical protein [Chloroflexota bacterium]
MAVAANLLAFGARLFIARVGAAGPETEVPGDHLLPSSSADPRLTITETVVGCDA